MLIDATHNALAQLSSGSGSLGLTSAPAPAPATPSQPYSAAAAAAAAWAPGMEDHRSTSITSTNKGVHTVDPRPDSHDSRTDSPEPAVHRCNKPVPTPCQPTAIVQVVNDPKTRPVPAWDILSYNPRSETTHLLSASVRVKGSPQGYCPHGFTSPTPRPLLPQTCAALPRSRIRSIILFPI